MEYVIGAIIVLAFIGVILVMAKKEGNNLENMLSNLTEEQKRTLEDNQIENFDDKKHTWVQRGMIAQVCEKNNKVALKVLWYNTIIQNATLNKCQYADISMKKSEFESHGLKNGDFVKIYINPEKCKVNIVFD